MIKKSLSQICERAGDKICVDAGHLFVLNDANVDKRVVNRKCLERLSDNYVVVTTRLENSQNVFDRLLCCLRKVSTAIILNYRIVNLVFAIIEHGGNKMKKIDISETTDEIVRRNGRMGETYDDVIRRGFTYLDSCSEFWNEE